MSRQAWLPNEIDLVHVDVGVVGELPHLARVAPLRMASWMVRLVGLRGWWRLRGLVRRDVTIFAMKPNHSIHRD